MVGGYSTRCTDSPAQFHWAWTRELAGLRLEEQSKPRFTLRSVRARGCDYRATRPGFNVASPAHLQPCRWIARRDPAPGGRGTHWSPRRGSAASARRMAGRSAGWVPLRETSAIIRKATVGARTLARMAIEAMTAAIRSPSGASMALISWGRRLTPSTQEKLSMRWRSCSGNCRLAYADTVPRVGHPGAAPGWGPTASLVLSYSPDSCAVDAAVSLVNGCPSPPAMRAR